MDFGLTGTTCVVTGASSGIGLATARMLAGEGADVVLVARNRERLEAAAGEVGGRALPLDVTDAGAGERVVEACGGRIDALVNNAGTSELKPLEELTDADWQAQWELNVMASMRLMREVAPLMADRGGGRIVNVTSSSGKRPSLRNAAYSVAKAAQLSMSRVFSDAYAGRGVNVNAVAPGMVETPLWMGRGGLADQIATAAGTSREEALAKAAANVPRGRFGTEEEIAAVIVFLCSPLAANVTGAAWSVDGGTVPVIL